MLAKKYEITEEKLLQLVYEDTVRERERDADAINFVQQLAIHPLGNFAFQQMYQNSEPPTRLDVISVLEMFELALN